MLSKDRSTGPIPEGAGYWISGKTGENDLKDLIGSPIKRTDPQMVAQGSEERPKAHVGRAKNSARPWLILFHWASARVLSRSVGWFGHETASGHLIERADSKEARRTNGKPRATAQNRRGIAHFSRYTLSAPSFSPYRLLISLQTVPDLP